MTTASNSTDVLSDGSIIDAVRSGHRESFTLIVRRYEAALLKVAISRLGRQDWAEDVVQETFLWAYKSLHTYNAQYSFRTWLWTILINQCNRHYQKRSRQPQVGAPLERSVVEDAVAADSENSPHARLLAKELGEELANVLNQLPTAQADALRLRFYGGLKFHEIADAMGCCLSSAKNRVRNGLLRMSELLSAKQPDSSSGATR